MVPPMEKTDKRSNLQSAAHWLDQISVAETEDRHEVVVRLFELAIECGAQPTEEIIEALQACRERYSQKREVRGSNYSSRSTIARKARSAVKGRPAFSSSKTSAPHRTRLQPVQERTCGGVMNEKHVMDGRGNNMQGPSQDWYDRVLVAELPVEDAVPASATVRMPVGRAKLTRMVLTTQRGNSLELHVTRNPTRSEGKPVRFLMSREDAAQQSLQDLRRTVYSIVGNAANVPLIDAVEEVADSKDATDEDMAVDSLSAFSEDDDSTDASEAATKTCDCAKRRCSYRSGGGNLTDSDKGSSSSDDAEDGSQSFRSIDIRSETDDDVSLAEIRAAMKSGLKLSGSDGTRRALRLSADPFVAGVTKVKTAARNGQMSADITTRVRCTRDNVASTVGINSKLSASLRSAPVANRTTATKGAPLLSPNPSSQAAACVTPDATPSDSPRLQTNQWPTAQSSDTTHAASPAMDVDARGGGTDEKALSVESSVVPHLQQQMQTSSTLAPPVNDAPVMTFGQEGVAEADARSCDANGEAVGSTDGEQEDHLGEAAVDMVSVRQVSEGFSATTPPAATAQRTTPKPVNHRSPRRARHSRSWSMIGGILDEVSNGKRSPLLSGPMTQEALGRSWQATFPWRRSFGGEIELDRGTTENLPGHLAPSHAQQSQHPWGGSVNPKHATSGTVSCTGSSERSSTADFLQRSLHFENVAITTPPTSFPVADTPSEQLSGSEPNYQMPPSGGNSHVSWTDSDQEMVASVGDESGAPQSEGSRRTRGPPQFIATAVGWRPFESPGVGDSGADSSRTPSARDSTVESGRSQQHSLSGFHDDSMSMSSMHRTGAPGFTPGKDSGGRLRRQILSSSTLMDSADAVGADCCQDGKAADGHATGGKGQRNFAAPVDSFEESVNSKDVQTCSEEDEEQEEGRGGVAIGEKSEDVTPMATAPLERRVSMFGSQCQYPGSSKLEKSDSFLSLRSILNTPMYSISDTDDSSNDECDSSVDACRGGSACSQAEVGNGTSALQTPTATAAHLGSRADRKSPDQRLTGWLPWRSAKKDVVSSSSGETEEEPVQKSMRESCGNGPEAVQKSSRESCGNGPSSDSDEGGREQMTTSSCSVNSDEQYQLAVSMNSRNSRPFRLAKEMTIDEEEEFHDVDSPGKTVLSSPPPSPVAAKVAIQPQKPGPHSVRSRRVRPNVYSTFRRMKQQAASESLAVGTCDRIVQTDSMDLSESKQKVADLRGDDGKAGLLEVGVAMERISQAMLPADEIGDGAQNRAADIINRCNGDASVSIYSKAPRSQVEHAFAKLLGATVAEDGPADPPLSNAQSERMVAGDNARQAAPATVPPSDNTTGGAADSFEGRCGREGAPEKSCEPSITDSPPERGRMGWPLCAIHRQDSAGGRVGSGEDGQEEEEHTWQQKREDNTSGALPANGQASAVQPRKMGKRIPAMESLPVLLEEETSELGGKERAASGNPPTGPALGLEGLVSLGANTPSRDYTFSGTQRFGVLGSISASHVGGQTARAETMRTAKKFSSMECLPVLLEEVTKLAGNDRASSGIPAVNPALLQLEGLVSLGSNTPIRDHTSNGKLQFSPLGSIGDGSVEGQMAGTENVKALPSVRGEETKLGGKGRPSSREGATHSPSQMDGLVELGPNQPSRGRTSTQNRRCGVLGLIGHGHGLPHSLWSKALPAISASTVHASSESGRRVLSGHSDLMFLSQDQMSDLDMSIESRHGTDMSVDSRLGVPERRKKDKKGRRLDVLGPSEKDLAERKRRRKTMTKIAKLCCFL
ncbi:hypothetical protein CBR_g24071 [Chara braunii]|uniref:Uncharacterized protein n=1 Tax=Chara braunii TaxID=69332 RepID=A0A388L5Q0_CHABU|nr:hypothetical protein CBR_g24071 [Chara braunii]|eukprot:GBG77625.1 hypothetical protein CBR_g24071 [Chara braunii]